jgi:hypothetical protein
MTITRGDTCHHGAAPPVTGILVLSPHWGDHGRPRSKLMSIKTTSRRKAFAGAAAQFTGSRVTMQRPAARERLALRTEAGGCALLALVAIGAPVAQWVRSGGGLPEIWVLIWLLFGSVQSVCLLVAAGRRPNESVKEAP